jgi:hypothetical protein
MVREKDKMEINKIELHEQIILGMHETFMKKANDYGDNYEKVRAEFPNAILIRLSDKINRLKNLMSGVEQLVDNENIDDTLLDICGYSILEMLERKIDAQYLAQYIASYKKPKAEIDKANVANGGYTTAIGYAHKANGYSVTCNNEQTVSKL